MKFDTFDAKMRIFETAHDYSVLPDLYIVARLDGRTFTRLTKEVHKFERPFDIRFRDCMVATTAHLMTCGFRVLYGYTQSDEISLLLHLQENAFGRQMRKLNSILAGEASAKFSLLLGDIGTFDCRLSQLPTKALVVDYFQWRDADATRNALNSYCYWQLRQAGKSIRQATKMLEGISVAAKNELLFGYGINFNNLPTWQKRGSGLYWESYQKEAINPLTKQTVFVTRRRLKHDFELPMKEEYAAFILRLIDEA